MLRAFKRPPRPKSLLHVSLKPLDQLEQPAPLRLLTTAFCQSSKKTIAWLAFPAENYTWAHGHLVSSLDVLAEHSILYGWHLAAHDAIVEEDCILFVALVQAVLTATICDPCGACHQVGLSIAGPRRYCLSSLVRDPCGAYQ